MEFLKKNDQLIHFRWYNRQSDRTFIFINSLGTDFRIWEDVVETMQLYGNILLFDNRGHGLSDVVERTKGLQDFVDDVEALLNHLAIKNFIPIGLSVGGMIAQLLANRLPTKIEKLILCDTLHKIGTDQIWNERIGIVKEKGISAISEGVMQRWFSEKFRMEEPNKVSGYRNMLERTLPIGYIKTMEAIRDADLTAISSEINIPTLCIVGSEDKSTTPEEVKGLAKLIKGSRYELIEGSGHIPCADNPSALTSLIIDFVN
jgi:3-oxoadipate enol-lactonase